MTPDEFRELLQPRDLPDQDRVLREVLASVSTERASAAASGRDDDATPEPIGFSDSAFRPITSTPSPSRRWLTLAVAAAMAIVVGGIGWSVVTQSAVTAQPGGQVAPQDPPPPTQTPMPTSPPNPTPTSATGVPGDVQPPSVTVLETRAAGDVLFVTYRLCSGSGVATLTGPFADREASVELPSGMPPRLVPNENIGPDECVLRGDAFARPEGPVNGRLDVRFLFENGTPERQFNAYYGDLYSG